MDEWRKFLKLIMQLIKKQCASNRMIYFQSLLIILVWLGLYNRLHHGSFFFCFERSKQVIYVPLYGKESAIFIK